MINTPFLKENLIAYIGNKRRLLYFLNENFQYLIEKDKKIKTSADLFAGSGSVSRLFKSLGLEVHSNDWEYYSYILNYAHLSINENDVDNMFLHLGGVDNIINTLNEMSSIDEDNIYISKYYAPKDDNNPDLINERIFYTQYNALKIDTIRHHIELLHNNNVIDKKEYFYLLSTLLYQAATCANTSGVFKAFHYGFGGRNADALSRIMKPLIINKLPLINGKKCSVSMLDALEFSEKNKDKEFDIVYLDPPYNQHQYGSNYHLLNTIALWDKPYVNKDIYIDGKKTDKSAIRKDWTKTRSDYCYKKSAPLALTNLLNNLNARYITLSYSTDGIINYNDLLDTLNSYGNLTISTSEYTRYRGAKRSLVNTKKNIEYLFIVDTKKKLKATSTINMNSHAINNVRLMLNFPFESKNNNIEFLYNGCNISIKLKHKTHSMNTDSICKSLENKSLDFVENFRGFIEKNIKKDNMNALMLYIKKIETAYENNNSAEIRYFANHILSVYSSFSNSNSSEYISSITESLVRIIKNNDESTKKMLPIEEIKKRIDYNKKYLYVKS